MTTETKNSYQENLAELREQLKGMLPPEAMSVFDQDASQLNDRFETLLQVQPGDKAPDFELPDATGKTVSLQQLLTDGPVVLAFYRGAWCPYCNLQLSLYQKALDKIKAAGATLVAVSPQTPDHALSMQEKNELRFPVLTDSRNEVARQYTTVFRNGDAPVATMASLGYDFDSFYENNSREIPVPAVFIIDQTGVVTFAKTEGGDYRNRVAPDEVLHHLIKIREKNQNLESAE